MERGAERDYEHDETDTAGKRQPDEESLSFPAPSEPSKGLAAALPFSVRLILLSEVCERFAYYGVAGLLQTFFTDELGYDDATTVLIVSMWQAACYISPLLGGFVSDSYWGKFRTIITFSIIYVIGCSILAITAWPPAIALGAFIGIFTLALGTGGIKPCVSSFGAQQFPPSDEAEERLGTYFRIFYWCINLGSLGAFVIIPTVKAQVGYHWAFLIPAILLAVATFVVFVGRKRYINEPIEGSIFVTIYQTIKTAIHEAPRSIKISCPMRFTSALCCCGRKSVSESIGDDEACPIEHDADEKPHWLDWAAPVHGNSVVRDIKATLRILPVFATLPFFWMLFNQINTTWVTQAGEMKLPSFMEQEHMQLFNALSVMILLPVFDRVVYPFFTRANLFTRDLDKFGVGMLLTGLSFVLAGVVQSMIENNDPLTVSCFFQLFQIVTITCGEIMVSTQGLEFAYSQAPVTMKSFITALFLTTNAIGSTLVGPLFSLFDWIFDATLSHVFFAFSGLMVIVFVIFWFLVRPGYVYADFVKNPGLEQRAQDKSEHVTAPLLSHDDDVPTYTEGEGEEW